MPKESTAKPKKAEKKVSVDNLRHAEYYAMQQKFDELYAKSKAGETFTNLMDIILSRENILLAYRNIKANTGSMTQGTDGLTIKDIGALSPEDVVQMVRYIIEGTPFGYQPKPVRRKEIPKPNGSTRPLGIPCIWNRLIQQCIKQVMEPICEAKFSDNSYGFRPQRSVENAIKAVYNRLQLSKLHYVIEFDIKGFFDNVDHKKLIRQIWAMGIQDTHLIFLIKRILKAKIKMPDGTLVEPTKGTPQGGIISPLLANIVLNELDHWVESQWECNPVTEKYSQGINHNGSANKGNGYRAMKSTNLKEMYIGRYADDFRIFCRTKTDAENTKIAVTQWLEKRLKLEVSQEKTRVVNAKRQYSEFLGFKIKLNKKSNKDVVCSHISDKKLKQEKAKLVSQAKNVARPRTGKTERDEIMFYNSMVMGMQSYYQIATNVNLDCAILNRAVMIVFTNRLRTQRGCRLLKSGRKLTEGERKKYGKSKMLRFVAGTEEPIYPIGYVKHKNPMGKKRSVCQYTPEGRKEIHDNLRVNIGLLTALMRTRQYGRSIDYADNRLSLFSAQWGKCAITNKDFTSVEEIHCHHINPRRNGGTDKYQNLVLVTEEVHRLIHSTVTETIKAYLEKLNLNADQMKKLNKLRELVGNPAVTAIA